jgi:hypothetical protein
MCIRSGGVVARQNQHWHIWSLLSALIKAIAA